MMRASAWLCLALAVSVPAARTAAAPLATAAPLSDTALPDRDPGEISSTDPELPPVAAPSKAPAANPLWAVPLGALSETRTRPLFSPSRRPPPSVAIVRHRPPKRMPPRPAPPEQPPLQLLGTIVGEAKGFGLFLDTSSKAMVRLKTGSIYNGWVLRTVRERTVVLEKNHLDQTLSLPTPAKVHVQPAASAPAPARTPRRLLRHAPPQTDAADGSGAYN